MLEYLWLDELSILLCILITHFYIQNFFVYMKNRLSYERLGMAHLEGWSAKILKIKSSSQ